MSNEDMIWQLLHVAMDNHIDVQWAGVLSPYTPPACRVDTRIVCMNNRWHRPQEIAFQLAHELSHIINGEPEDLCFYTASFTGKASVEYKANVGAVKLLVPSYCAEVDQDVVNVTNLEQRYMIPGYLDNVVREQVKEYYVNC
ncbi:ImmA/IrrE family metallo-endopeptidase [Limosilactobacillus caecicola]|uniref:ImmA/IrrE family metallo-endopeptidase n=1 Tax=Limosilactobacillus caecicola TaxID=2941332 RepID=UPI00283AAA42|nr:ImmA/IrrE family metallo-endopeptidase [Limosilactobacillus caecicola]